MGVAEPHLLGHAAAKHIVERDALIHFVVLGGVVQEATGFRLHGTGLVRGLHARTHTQTQKHQKRYMQSTVNL